jgi:hypothetical protein
MTGDATTIRLQRERDQVERLIRINALNWRAIDRYNELSDLITTLTRKA